MPLARSAAETGLKIALTRICENFSMDERRDTVQA
jgi:hypothetical protein